MENMCKWIINYRLLSAILLTQMFRRRDSEQKGRIPLCGVILTVNSSPQHKLFPVFSPQALLAAAPSPGASAAPPVLLLHSCTHQPGSGGCAQREIENYSSFFQALKGTFEKGDFPSYLWKTNPVWHQQRGAKRALDVAKCLWHSAGEHLFI